MIDVPSTPASTSEPGMAAMGTVAGMGGWPVARTASMARLKWSSAGGGGGAVGGGGTSSPRPARKHAQAYTTPRMWTRSWSPCVLEKGAVVSAGSTAAPGEAGPIAVRRRA